MKKRQQRTLMEKYRSDPIEFFKLAWPDIYIWDKLEEVAFALAQNRRVIVPSGHGVGKTWIAARLALWFLTCFFPSKVITTAPTWPQVEMLLWSEIKSAYHSSNIPLGGRVLSTDLKISDDWFATGFSTRGKAAEREFGTPKFQGYHSENILILLDEAPGVEHEIWLSVESLIVGVNNKILGIGNPTSPSGDFYNACKSPLWKKIKISSFDHPNVREDRVIVPGAVTRQWIEERRQEWVEGSPLWQAKILGEFPSEGTDTLIPLSWVEACVGLDLGTGGVKRLGVDVARFGDDKTALCAILGATVAPIEAVNKKDTVWTAGRVQILNKTHQFDYIGIDDTGVGGGVTDILTNEGLNVEGMNFGSSPIDDRMFDNLCTEIYWNLREDIRLQKISLPDDKDLINQLCSRKYIFTRKGKYRLESKEDMRKRGLPSPDKADALAIANSVGRLSSMPQISIISIDDDEL